MDKDTIAHRLDSILKLRNISQRELASIADISPQIISNIITGRSYSPEMLEKVAKGLNIKVEYLLGQDDVETMSKMDIDFFHECQAITLNACKKEFIEISNTRQLHSLAMELYTYFHNYNITTMDEKRGEAFIHGYLTMQIKMGLINKQK
jgi:transcriptional regulator with XRE-family HTH domain